MNKGITIQDSLSAGYREAIINEVNRIPVLTGSCTIGMFLQLMRRDTNEVVKDLHSINVETGEAFIVLRDAAGQIMRDEETGGVAMQRVVLDLRLYFFQFVKHGNHGA